MWNKKYYTAKHLSRARTSKHCLSTGRHITLLLYYVQKYNKCKTKKGGVLTTTTTTTKIIIKKVNKNHHPKVTANAWSSLSVKIVLPSFQCPYNDHHPKVKANAWSSLSVKVVLPSFQCPHNEVKTVEPWKDPPILIVKHPQHSLLLTTKREVWLQG